MAGWWWQLVICLTTEAAAMRHKETSIEEAKVNGMCYVRNGINLLELIWTYTERSIFIRVQVRRMCCATENEIISA